MPPCRSESHFLFFVSLAILLIALSLYRLAGFSKPDEREVLKKEQVRKDPPKADLTPQSLSRPSSRFSNRPSRDERGFIWPRTEKSDPETFWLEVQKELASTIREKIPDARLSDRALREVTRQIRTLRDSLQAASETERSGDNVEALKNARSQIGWTHELFRENTGFTIAEFIQRVRDETGIDHDQPDDEEVVVEYIRDPRP